MNQSSKQLRASNMILTPLSPEILSKIIIMEWVKFKLKFDGKQLISSLNRFFSKAHQVLHNLLILLKTITKLLALWMIVPLWVMKWLQCVPNFPFIASRGSRSLWVWKKKTSKVFVSFCLYFFLIALSRTAKELIPKELIISRVNYKFSLSFSRW